MQCLMAASTVAQLASQREGPYEGGFTESFRNCAVLLGVPRSMGLTLLPFTQSTPNSRTRHRPQVSGGEACKAGPEIIQSDFLWASSLGRGFGFGY